MAKHSIVDVGPRVLPEDCVSMGPHRAPPIYRDGWSYAFRDKLLVITTIEDHADGREWLHVSCSRKNKMPSYEDLCRVKEVFVGDDQKAIMVFPPKEEHVNFHPRCLHLFCCLTEDPLPDFRPGPGMI